jgi:hypothetical protein
MLPLPRVGDALLAHCLNCIRLRRDCQFQSAPLFTVNGDKASVTVIKEGFETPTAVELAGDTIWVAERGVGKAGTRHLRLS